MVSFHLSKIISKIVPVLLSLVLVFAIPVVSRADGSSSSTFSGGTAPYQVTGLKPNSPNPIDMGSSSGQLSRTWRFEYLVNPRFNHSGDNYLTGSAVYNFKIDIAMGNTSTADINFVPVLEPIMSSNITTLFYITRSEYTNFHYYLEFSLTSVLDNYYCPSNTLYNIPFHIDVVDLSSNSSYSLYNTMSNSISVVASSGSIVQSASPDQDLASVIAAGINQSSDIDSILVTLSAISSNTQLLTSVVSQLQNVNSILATLYTQVTLQQSHLYKLAWAITGIRPTDPDSDISTITFNRWVDIISTALNQSHVDTSQFDQGKKDLDDQVSQNESIENGIFTNVDTAFLGLDLTVTPSAGVVAAAAWLTGLAGSFFDLLGPLQYVIIASCTIGLFILVFGAINKINKRTH